MKNLFSLDNPVMLIFLTIGFSGLAKLNCWLLCRKVEGLAPKLKDKSTE